ncbi:uncharacterized protein LOC112572373 [Pomacea canaliculata]|uniref:uncharacterized protein LOC112572373 n=1 Tax=Pomacea canaliculata TaxID=400727 RepID=UPI000D73C2F9|nr:uncharacterized protein LOC112572373 [Pomacea canaliculata]
MARAESTTMRARKVFYDDHNHAFYVESRVEALERQVATRAKLTNVLNRSHDSRLSYLKKKVNSEQNIFEKKNERETTFHRDQLKDHVAHMHVLHDLARTQVSEGRRNSHLGAYGLGASRLDLLPLIEQSVKDDSPAARRRTKSQRIQSRRRQVPVFDRTQTTSALLKMRSQIMSRPTSEFLFSADSTSSGVSRRLVLPPITLRRSQDSGGHTTPGSHILRGSGKDSLFRTKNSGQSVSIGSTVFITQKHF